MPNHRVIAIMYTAALTWFWMGMNTASALSCAARVSIGDQGVGISAIEDASCMNGGLGCFSDGICRFCQTFASPQSNHLMICSSLTPSTQPLTLTPTTATPTVPTPAPTAIDCAAIAARSSFTQISFVTDTTCNVARPTAMGCVALTNCRLCRATKNENNQFLIKCSVLQNTTPGSVRRLLSDETLSDVESPEPRNFTGIALGCVGGMALVVAIIGLAHSKFCRREINQANCAVDETGLATDDDTETNPMENPDVAIA